MDVTRQLLIQSLVPAEANRLLQCHLGSIATNSFEFSWLALRLTFILQRLMDAFFFSLPSGRPIAFYNCTQLFIKPNELAGSGGCKEKACADDDVCTKWLHFFLILIVSRTFSCRCLINWVLYNVSHHVEFLGPLSDGGPSSPGWVWKPVSQVIGLVRLQISFQHLTPTLTSLHHWYGYKLKLSYLHASNIFRPGWLNDLLR